MKSRYKTIDKRFREALLHHTVTPSEEARRAFLKEAGAIMPLKGNSKRWLWWTSLILIPSGAAVLIWIALGSGDGAGIPVPSSLVGNPSGEKGSPGKTTEQVSYVAPEIPSPSIEHVPFTKTPQIPDRKHPATTTPAPLTPDLRTAEPAAFPVRPSVPSESFPEGKQTAVKQDIEPSLPPPDADRSDQDVEIPESIPATTGAIPDTAFPKPEKNTPEIHTERPRSAKLSLHLGSGICWSPEWMFNTLEGTKSIHTFAMEGVFSMGPYSIRTGAGLHIGKGTNEVLIDYHDYLGAYNKLDSMDFHYNTSTQKYVPVYYMSQREVWDSLMKTDQGKIVKRYTYLQIPLILGYDFLRLEHFSLGLRVGPQLSILLSTKQLSAPYEPGKKMVVKVNDIAPGQIDLNWQLLAGLNASVSLSDRWRLEVEPFAKYYFNSVYEKPVNQQKPWSAGIRTALMFKF